MTVVRSSRVIGVVRASGRGLIGNGCVAEAASPGTSLGGDGPLLDAEDRRACRAVEDEDQPHLGQLDDRRNGACPLMDVGQDRLRRQVVVPQIVVHELKVPAPFAGRGVEGDQ